MPEHQHQRTFLPGTEVISEDGDKIGTIADVIVDDRTLDPKWLVVKPGPFRAAHYAPARDAYTATDETVVLPVAKDTVIHAQRASHEHFLTRNEEVALCEYYGIAV